MSSSKKSLIVASVRLAARFFRWLPLQVALGIAWAIGIIGYYLLPKKKAVVYANLKTLFAGQKSPKEINYLTYLVFINFAKSFVELLCIPTIKRQGFEGFVQLEGKEHLDIAMQQGKGIVFLGLHSGSWELASMVGSMTGYPYNIVANEQPKAPELDDLLNEYRRMAGAKVIAPGVATKEIIRVLQANEIVSLIIDQGGKDGIPVKFFGKTASMSTGAIRLALKYGCAICPVWMERTTKKQLLIVSPAIDLSRSGDFEKDIKDNVQKCVTHFEELLRKHPQEYLWFYKVFKYSTQTNIVICDDGKTGHLRQSQAISRSMSQILKKRNKQVFEHIVKVEFKTPFLAKCFSLYVWKAQFLPFLRGEDCLRHFLTESSFNSVMSVKADYVISCGSQTSGVNFILSRNHLAKSVHILKPGLLSFDSFEKIVMPEHDGNFGKANVITTKVAPNLMTSAYLKSQGEQLLNHYSHLKGNVRTKIGVLLGGNTKGVVFQEAKVRQLLNQVKEAATHYNAEILFTTSRRTPSDIEQLVLKELKNFERCSLCVIANQNNIPQAVGGILDLADLVIVSGESISMVSEALSSGKKTIVFPPQGDYLQTPRDKYERFVFKLNDAGYLIASSLKDLSKNIAQLLSHKIALKTLDDEQRITNALEGIV